jgi:hypothetical protein
MYQESEKSLELVERNLSLDNRQLRAKIHSLEQEKVLINEQIAKSLELVREKDKVIASLSIYRYNAIHRKQEQQCKICAKREREEKEQKRNQQIFSKLPPLEIEEIKVESAARALLQLGCEEIERYEYSTISISYSDDPTMSNGVQTIKVDKPESLKDILVDGLTSGLVYYFRVCSGHEKVYGQPSKLASILVDMLPEAPRISSARAKLSPPAIQILFSPPVLLGSQIISYRLYRSFTSDFKEFFLAFDEQVDKLQRRGNFLVFTISDPQLTIPYYFKVSACNTMGEGPQSEVSIETIVDMVPPRPEKPIVKKIAIDRLKITAINPVPLGSPPTKFKIRMCRTKEQEDGSQNVENTEEIEEILVDQIVSSRNNEFQYSVDSVERGTTYKFAIKAINSQGESEQSEWSDEVDIGMLISCRLDGSLMRRNWCDRWKHGLCYDQKHS